MPQTSKDNLKKYFETGDKPTQTEYAELINAMRHVDEKLPIADVETLQASLDSKATTAALLNHINDNSLHSASMTGAEIKAAYEAEPDTNPFTNNEQQQIADGVMHRNDTGSHVSTTDRTNWDAKLDAGGYGGSAQDLKNLIDNINFLDTSNPPVFVDSNDSDALKDSIRFTFNDGTTVDVSIKDLSDLGAFNSVATNGLHNLDFTTLGGQTISVDLDDWFNRKVTLNESGDPLKVFNELGQAVFTPQLKYNSVLIDNVNGDDTTGQLENYSNPFQTIQAAMNAYRESAGYNSDNFLTIEFAREGDYTFEYMSVHNVIFQSNLAVNIKAISVGENFTANGLDVGHTHYSSFKGSLILDMPAGTFENRYIDDGTFVRQPNFNLDNFVIRSLKKITVYNKTRLQYNYTGYSKPIPFTVNNYCDLGEVDVDTNMSFVFIGSTAKKSNIHFGDVVIHKQDEAVENADASIINPITLANSYVDVSFSYASVTIAATSQTTTIVHMIGDMTSPVQFGNVTNDTSNSDCVLFSGSNGSQEYILQFNNATLDNCLITQSPNIRFTGTISSTSSTKITGTGGSWVQSWVFDNFSGNFNLSDTSTGVLLYLYQIGLNNKNASPTRTLYFINTTIKSKGAILIIRDADTANTYPALDFMGSNILECETGELINGYLNSNVRMFKTGTLITNKVLPANVSIIPITDSGFYQEIT